MLLACEKPVPPPIYELRAPFAVPDGTEVVVDGKVAGAFAEQRVRLEFGDERTLDATRTLALRFHTACGHADRSFTLTGDSLEGRKTDDEAGKRKPLRVTLAMKPEDLVSPTTVWVDPDANAEVKVGAKTLNKGPNRFLLTDCDEKGRTVTVDGKSRGTLPEVDAKEGEQVFVPADPKGCYALVGHSYEKGVLKPDERSVETLPPKPLHAVPLVNFVLRKAPDTIDAIPGSPKETKKQLAKVDCPADERE